LEIIITLFKVYFRLNTLRLCKNLINAVNSRQFLPFDAFPASQRVTYKYYTGRLAIFDENYVRDCPNILIEKTFATWGLNGWKRFSACSLDFLRLERDSSALVEEACLQNDLGLMWRALNSFHCTASLPCF
jgi:hypothetical protein